MLASIIVFVPHTMLCPNTESDSSPSASKFGVKDTRQAEVHFPAAEILSNFLVLLRAWERD
jgi:hypothetical protein